MKIQSTKDIKPERLNALVYGPSGCGKTTMASTLVDYNPVIISLESGLLSLKKYNIDYVEIDAPTPKGKYDQLRETLIQVQKSDYKTVFIDSLTDVAQVFVNVCKEDYPDARQGLQMWGKYSEMMNGFIKYTRDMNKNIIYTALQKTHQDEIGRRFNGPEMQGSVATKCVAQFDFVFAYRTQTSDEGEIKRALLTSGNDEFIAKDRSGFLETFEKPHLGNIIKKVFQ